jgi:hypothetical protein
MPAKVLNKLFAACMREVAISIGIDVITSPAACAVFNQIVFSSAPESRRANNLALLIVVSARGQSRRTCSNPCSRSYSRRSKVVRLLLALLPLCAVMLKD